MKPLEPVFAIGTPVEEGLSSSVTAGVVSGIRRHNDLEFIQADAAISPGNSGGPLTDKNGNVVGVSVLKKVIPGSEGLGFFIPIDAALDTLNLRTNPPGT